MNGVVAPCIDYSTVKLQLTFLCLLMILTTSFLEHLNIIKEHTATIGPILLAANTCISADFARSGPQSVLSVYAATLVGASMVVRCTTAVGYQHYSEQLLLYRTGRKWNYGLPSLLRRFIQRT